MEWILFISLVFWGPYLAYGLAHLLSRQETSPGVLQVPRQTQA